MNMINLNAHYLLKYTKVVRVQTPPISTDFYQTSSKYDVNYFHNITIIYKQ